MKTKLTAAALLALALPAAATAGKPIERYQVPGAKPAPILLGVSVPAGADMLYLSGQIANPIDPAKAGQEGLTMADFGDTKTQTISVLTKVRMALEAHGFALSDVVKLTVYVAGDPKLGGKMDFAGMNAGYKMFFGSAENPNTVARSTIQVAALAGPPFLVEIEATAAKVPAGR